MEHIKEAIKLAKQQRMTEALAGTPAIAAKFEPGARVPQPPPAGRAIRMLQTDPSHLERNRIVAAHAGHPQVALFDMLRTKTLQEMDQHDWKVIVVTSPSIGCGKTVCAINLALSLSRQPDRPTYLVDLDLRRPKVAHNLGVKLEHDLAGALRGKPEFEDAMFHVDIAGPQLTILANKQPMAQPVEAISSRPMKALFDRLRSSRARPVIIVDMPPVLHSDDVLAFLPQADCCILVVAEGTSTVGEIDNAKNLLSGTNFLGCVLTKSNERARAYY